MTDGGRAQPLAATTARLLLADTARAQRTGRLPSLVAGAVRGGALVWHAGRGLVDGVEPDADVQYRIGSISKTVTAIAVLRLRDEGLLRLDDSLDTHLAGTPFGDRTIGQLLAHNAGLRAEAPGEWWERTPGIAWDDFARGLTDDDVPHAAGRRFHYSNLGFGVLGELAARLRGKPWDDVVRDEVLLPLGMVRTTCRPSGRAAQGYAVHPWADVVIREPEHHGGAMAPAGQLWATLADLGRLAAFLLGDTGEVLSAETLEEMRQPAGIDAASPGWSAYGLGLQVLRVDGATYVGHGGSMPGFVAGLLVEVEQGNGAVLMANATSGVDGGLTQRMLATVREHEPRIVEPWLPMTATPDDALTLTGQWYWGTYAYGLRLRSDGLLELIGLLGSGRTSTFRRRDDGTWVGLLGYHVGEPLRPVHDAAGAVVALDLGSFIFTRTPYDPAAPVPGGVDPQGWGPAPR